MKNKRFAAILLTAVITASMSTTAFAAGWQQNETGWWWQNEDGTWPANSWQWLDGNHDGIAECYYFDGNGYLLTSSMTPDGYMVNADGAWIVGDIVQTQTAAGKSDGLYKMKIHTQIWDMMDHTYAENRQKYPDVYPYEPTYYTGFLSEEESADIKPYIIVLNSQKAPLNTMFEDAPDVSVYTTIEEIGDQLERMGYDVEWGRTDLNTTDTCWIKIDRFEIAFVVYPGIRYEIRIKQPLSEKSAEAMNDAFRAETVYAGMIK